MRRPEHLLGLKPSLPDAKLAAHPCRWLSKGDLPKALPGSAQPSGRDWGSAEQPDKQSEFSQLATMKLLCTSFTAGMDDGVPAFRTSVI